MRIRLRVPKDEYGTSVPEQDAGGFLDRLLGFFRSGPKSDAPPPPAPPAAPSPAPASKADRRWTPCGDAHYILAGRLCLLCPDFWRPEYVFDVLAAGSKHTVRIQVPEEAVTAWEQERGQRMTEAARLGLARQTLEELILAGRFPAKAAVAAERIAAAEPR